MAQRHEPGKMCSEKRLAENSLKDIEQLESHGGRHSSIAVGSGTVTPSHSRRPSDQEIKNQSLDSAMYKNAVKSISI